MTPLYKELTRSPAWSKLTRRMSLRSLRLVEEAVEELEMAAALTREAIAEERKKHEKPRKNG